MQSSWQEGLQHTALAAQPTSLPQTGSQTHGGKNYVPRRRGADYTYFSSGAYFVSYRGRAHLDFDGTRARLNIKVPVKEDCGW